MMVEREREAPEISAAERMREELTAWDAVLKSAFRIAPYNPDLMALGRGYDVYEQMMSDAMCRAAINTKRFALLAKPWQVFPSERNSARAAEMRDFVEDALRGMTGPDGTTRDFRHALFQMMAAFYRGYSVSELIWRLEEKGRWSGRFTLAALKAKSPKQIGFEVDDYLNIQAITSWTPVAGFTIVPREKCVLYIYNPHDELPYGDSDFRAVYKHWWSKDALAKFWNLALQKYGAPMIYAQSSSNGAESERLLGLLQSVQQDATAIFPRDVTPQLLQSNMNADAFVNAVDWHNQQIAQGILLQTLTSGEGRRSGGRALGQVHFNVLLYALENAKADIEAAVNTQIVKLLIDYNYGPQGGETKYPRFALGGIDEKDIGPLASAYDVLLTHGVVGNREQAVREAFGLPPLEEGEN